MYVGKRNKQDLLSGCSKPIEKAKLTRSGRSTVLIDYADGTSSVRYHDTDVVTFLGDGNVVLNSGGFRSVTTKERINSYSPVTISQEKGVWYCSTSVEKDVVFYDGITFDSVGNLVGERVEVNEKKIRWHKKRISDYLKRLDKLDEIPFPDGGDCWLCMVFKDESCLEEHLDSKYIHGTLIVNAMREAGYRDESIYVNIRMNFKDNVKRALRKYFMKRLLPEIATN
ncbi:MAG TPA: hypothetical protein VGA67_02830 [Candidatus Dojkabacteria bacterium]